MEQNKNYQEPSFKNIAIIVANELENLYHKLYIPTESNRRIIQMLLDYHEKLSLIKKEIKKTEESSTVKQKVTVFCQHAQSSLFDICSCKCPNFHDKHCICSKQQQIPIEIQSFITDQRFHPGGNIITEKLLKNY